MPKFFTYYNSPAPVTTVPDLETVFVSQSEAIRASLKYQLETFGMDTLQAKLKETQSKFGYADTRFSKSFGDLCEQYARANDYFQSLPAQYRAQFGHDPIKFYSYIEKQPANAFKAGFISKDLAKTLGVSVDPVKTESVQTQSVSTEPVPTQPVQTEVE